MRNILRISSLLIFSCLTSSASAQFNLRPLMGSDSYEQSAEIYHLRRLPRDPLAHTSYEKGVAAIEAGNIQEGLETLQLVLNDTSDFFFYDGLQITDSLVSRIENVLSEHHEDYERLYGVEAQQQLDQALNNSMLRNIQLVVQKFAMTNAGAKALKILATTARDEGDYGLAARLFERVAHHGATSENMATVQQAINLYVLSSQHQPAARLIDEFESQLKTSNFLDGQFSKEKTQKFLQQLQENSIGKITQPGMIHEWHSPFGSEEHAGQTEFAPAVFDNAWNAKLIDEWDFGLLPTDLKRQLLAQTSELATTIETRIRSNTDRVTFPAATPIIVDNMIIARGDGTLKAFDTNTGELLWPTEAFVETTFTYLNQASHSPQQGRDPVRDEMRELFFAQRDWRDLTMSSLSTDGTNVYAISDCQLVGSVKKQLLEQNTTEHPLLPERRNLLTAYELGTEGKVLWSIGHASAGLNGIQERNIYILGAPLCVNDHLYVLGEERGQIQLFELDPATGSILWSLGLLNPEQDLLVSDDRRMAGLTPAYGGGLLFCPSGEGVITAIDPVRRSVVWTHQYANEQQSYRHRLLGMRGVRPQHQTMNETIREQLSDDRWFDSRSVVTGDYLIVTPPDDQALLCLNIHSGEEVWKLEDAAAQSIYIGAITSEHILLISRSEVSALRVNDGSLAWKNPIPIELPSGRGIAMGQQFLQPLITGEIAIIDMVNGRLISKLPLLSGAVAGNLVAANGMLFSQTGQTLTGFQSLPQVQQEIAKRQQTDTNSAQALALSGMLKLQQGRVEAGVNDLRKSAQQEPTERKRRVLAWAMLNGLQHEFSTYSKITDEIETYLSGSDQQLAYRRIYAQGLQDSGQYPEALDHYLQLLEQIPHQRDVRDISSRWAVNDERWVLARIQEVLTHSNTSNELESSLMNWLRRLKNQELLVRCLKSMPSKWIDQTTAITRLKNLPQTESPVLDRQAALLKLTKSDSSAEQAFALSELTNMALRQGDGSAAEVYLGLLQQRTDILPDGTSVEQFAEKIRATESWSEVLLAVPHWPQHIEVSDNPSRFGTTDRYPIPLIGPVTPELRGWTFMLDEKGTYIEISDAHGRKRSRMPTGLAQSRSMEMGAIMGRFVSTYGHLAVVVLVDRFLIIDLLSDPKQPKLILKQELIREEDDPYSSRGFIGAGQQPQAGLRTFVARTPTDSHAGNVGPICSSYLCYGLGTHLVAIDPTSGKELWRRRDIIQGSEIFGDDEYVILTPPGEKTLKVYSALDGQFIVERELPEHALNSCLTRRNADWGRFLPTRSIEKRLHWKLYDPATHQTAWETDYEIDTQWAPVDGVDIAFLESNKQLTIHDGLTGDKQVSLKLPMDFQPGTFSVLSSEDQWIFVVSQRTKLQLSIREFSTTTSLLSQPIDGLAIAVNRHTQKVQWSHTLENLSFPLHLPTQWPIIYFLNIHGQDMEVLILNRETGEVIMEDEWFNDQTQLAWAVKTQPMTIQLRLSRNFVQLDCTEPLEPSSNAPQPVAE